MMEVVRSCKLATGGIFLSQGFEVRINEGDCVQHFEAFRNPDGTLQSLSIDRRIAILNWVAESLLFRSIADTGFLTEALRNEWIEYIEQLRSRVNG